MEIKTTIPADPKCIQCHGSGRLMESTIEDGKPIVFSTPCDCTCQKKRFITVPYYLNRLAAIAIEDDDVVLEKHV